VARSKRTTSDATPHPLAVITLLDGNPDHPTPEAVHTEATKVLPTLSLKAV